MIVYCLCYNVPKMLDFKGSLLKEDPMFKKKNKEKNRGKINYIV